MTPKAFFFFLTPIETTSRGELSVKIFEGYQRLKMGESSNIEGQLYRHIHNKTLTFSKQKRQGSETYLKTLITAHYQIIKGIQYHLR